jgi:hypothetical protein
MKNKIEDLNNHLFIALERLNDEDLSSEDLDKEIKRSKAIKEVAETIVESHRNTIQAMKLISDQGLDLSAMVNGLGITVTKAIS